MADITKQRGRVPFIALVPFLLITFGIAWGILGLYLFLPRWMPATFGDLSGQHPLFYVAVYAPAIAAFSVVGYHGGRHGLVAFICRIAIWRGPWTWYAFLLVGIPLLFYAGAAIKGNLLAELMPQHAPIGLLLAMALMAIKGPVEEFGWRGLALPLLQRRYTPFVAGLMLGVVWGLWHLPAFLLSGTPQSAWSFTPFLAGSIAVSVIITPMFNAFRGSILLPALFHFQLINPVWPDAQPYDTIGFVLAAVLVCWINRASIFSRGSAAITVIPGGQHGNAPL